MTRKLSHAITSMDAFGAPISLNFKGKTSFQTFRGGILTVIIYILMFLQIWSQVNQLYTQTDPITAAYETSYFPEEIVNLTELKQQVTLGIRDTGASPTWIKDLDPRAIKLVGTHKKKSDGTIHNLEFDWCDTSINDNLSIVNKNSLAKNLCITEPD